MRTALMVLALLTAPAFAAQTVWKWVDEKGVTHYSDQPIPGAERIDIKTGNRADARPGSSSSSPSSSQSNSLAATEYTLEILKPMSQESFVNTGGVVEVRVRFNPDLQPGHSLVVTLDGTKVEASGSDFSLRDVQRGQHTLVAIILDGRGRKLKESAPIQFNVRQESVAQPPVGPNLRPPPPKPQPRN